MDNKNFAKRMKELREKAGLTQSELANEIGVSLFTIFRWEKGERQPRMEDIKKWL